jgi:hypothetical protein
MRSLRLSTLIIAIILGFSFNKPVVRKYTPCGIGKFWYSFNQIISIQEGSYSPVELGEARTPGNYSLLVALDECEGMEFLCCICATPGNTDPSVPNISSGTDVYNQLGYYIYDMPFSNGIIRERPE